MYGAILVDLTSLRVRP